MELKERLINIIKAVNSKKTSRETICDLNNLDDNLFLEIRNILFSEDEKGAYLGNILIGAGCGNELSRQKMFYEEKGDLKNFTKEIYDLREFISFIMPIYFPKYKVNKIYKSENPDFFIEFTNKSEIGIECCSLLVDERYKDMDDTTWKNKRGVRVLDYESINDVQLKNYEDHLKRDLKNKNTIYLFDLSGGARYICHEILNILEMQKLASKMKINKDNIFICIGKSGEHKTLENNWIKLSEVKTMDCCKYFLKK